MNETTVTAHRASMEDHFVCTQWLNEEAELLDDNRLRDWLELLHPDIEYFMPVRVTVERERGAGFSREAYHMYEDAESLTTRVDRLDTDFAWAENPASRTRRQVSNVRVACGAEGERRVRSNLLVYRGRLDSASFELLAGERHDLLVPTPGGLKLRLRRILFDHSTLPTKNLGLFF